ncbi:MAG TPA: hypothetical protein VFV95_11760 [Vicinamibacterales bacterium]|nr:hypothetical protein [Vicinamibacterales bacterium]
MPTSGGVLTSGEAEIQGLADLYKHIPASRKLVILNPGHVCSYTALGYQDSATVLELLNAGYDVLATYMPLLTPLQCGGTPTSSHDDLFDPAMGFRPAGGAHPLIYFLDPVRKSLNRALRKYGYSEVHMAGLSGGGWTTTLYAALDTRITTSIPVAGSLPFYMRSPSDAEQEDVPEKGNDFFRFLNDGTPVLTGYKDLYLLGSHGAGRRQVQVLNRQDDCCFGQGAQVEWDHAVRAYEAGVRQQIRILGAGSFRVEINEANDQPLWNEETEIGFHTHNFSKNTRVAVMLTEFDGAASLVDATNRLLRFERDMSDALMSRNEPRDGSIDTRQAMIGTPSIVTAAIRGHQYDAFYRDPFNRLVHSFFDGTSWTASELSQSRIISDPVAVSRGAGRIDVVALGADYRLYQWAYWGDWQPEQLVHRSALGVGSLAVTSSGPDRLDVLFRGHDSSLYHVQSNGGPPSTLTKIGIVGAIKGFPTAVSADGNLWVYVTGENDQLLEARYSGGQWNVSDLSIASGSTSVKIHGSPGAVLSPNGEITVYAPFYGSQHDEVGRYVGRNAIWRYAGAVRIPVED